MAILPVEKDGKVYAKVLEIKGELYVDLTPLMILESSCNYYGSSFEGRKQGTKGVSGITHKPPIAIDPMSDLYFFPTTSPKRIECIWVSLHHVLDSKPTSIANTLVTFTNKDEMEFPISPSSFETQMYRTSYLRTKLLQRVNGHGSVSEFREIVAAPPGVSYRSTKG
jgi:competence protein ComK